MGFKQNRYKDPKAYSDRYQHDTNVNTIDIPLPSETETTASASVATASVNAYQHVTNGIHPMASMAAAYANAYANPYAANALQPYPYYPCYPTAGAAAAYQQMPQMMVNTQFGYLMPQMQPIVPVIPQIQNQLTAQKAITAMNQAKVNAKSNEEYDEEEDEEEEETDSDPTVAKKPRKASNILPLHCNHTMGLNPLIYQNIQSSPYFKTTLFGLKTYHEVIDEIYYNVKHLEPWEKGSRKVGGQTGMCGSVRGVGAGGIISTPFCILYKLYTLKLTRKQVNSLIRHKDSPYIRALGFMYIRFTQPPQDLFSWFEPFLEDDEEVDPKAGGGQPMTIGQMVRHMLTKLDWFSTLFPRVPVPIQKQIEKQLKERDAQYEQQMREEKGIEDGEVEEEEEEVEDKGKRKGRPYVDGRSRDRDRRHYADPKYEKKRSRSRDKDRRSKSRDKESSRSDDRHKRRSRSPHSPHSHRYRDHRSDRDRNEHRHRRH